MRLLRYGLAEGAEGVDGDIKEARATLMGGGAVVGKADLGGGEAKAGGDQINRQVSFHREGQHRGYEFGLNMVAVADDGNGDEACFFFKGDQGFEIARVSGAGEMDGTADRGMAGKGDLVGGKEDTDAGGMGRVLRGLHKNGLGQVELARDGLHLLGGQGVGI